MFSDCEILFNETHVASVARVVLLKIGMPFSSDDLELVRDQIVSITLSNGEKRHVSAFSSVSSPSIFIASRSRTVANIEAVSNYLATQLADSYAVLAYVTII
jgi:hypothetical protein